MVHNTNTLSAFHQHIVISLSLHLFIGFQIELIKRREADFIKMRREYEEVVLKNEEDISAIRKKHNESVNELMESVS